MKVWACFRRKSDIENFPSILTDQNEKTFLKAQIAKLTAQREDLKRQLDFLITDSDEVQAENERLRNYDQVNAAQYRDKALEVTKLRRANMELVNVLKFLNNELPTDGLIEEAIRKWGQG